MRRFTPATILRIVLVLLTLSAVLFAYPVWRLGQWWLLPTWLNLVITLPLFLSQLIARILLRRRHGRIAFVLRGAADFLRCLTTLCTSWSATKAPCTRVGSEVPGGR